MVDGYEKLRPPSVGDPMELIDEHSAEIDAQTVSKAKEILRAYDATTAGTSAKAAAATAVYAAGVALAHSGVRGYRRMNQHEVADVFDTTAMAIRRHWHDATDAWEGSVE